MKFLNPKLNATEIYNVVVPIYNLIYLHYRSFGLQQRFIFENHTTFSKDKISVGLKFLCRFSVQIQNALLTSPTSAINFPHISDILCVETQFPGAYTYHYSILDAIISKLRAYVTHNFEIKGI